MPDNMRPHRPTLMTTLIVVALLFVIYHFTIGKK